MLHLGLSTPTHQALLSYLVLHKHRQPQGLGSQQAARRLSVTLGMAERAGGGGGGRSVSSPSARMGQCRQLGWWSPLKIKQPDVMLGTCCGSLNLTRGCGARLTPALGTEAGDKLDKTLPHYLGTLLMQQQGSCP